MARARALQSLRALFFVLALLTVVVTQHHHDDREIWVAAGLWFALAGAAGRIAAAR